MVLGFFFSLVGQKTLQKLICVGFLKNVFRITATKIIISKKSMKASMFSKKC